VSGCCRIAIGCCGELLSLMAFCDVVFLPREALHLTS
jgi:hypothetical protein